MAIIFLPADAQTPAPGGDQPLRWKGRWFEPVAGGLYEVRARWWNPQMGGFLNIDEFAYHDGKSTRWGWPNENPLTLSDPAGHCAACLGALVGGFANLGAFVATAPLSQVESVQGIAGAFLGGAIAGASATLGPAATAGGGLLGSLVQSSINGQLPTPEGLLAGTLGNLVGGALGLGLGKLAFSEGLLATDAVRQLARQQELEAIAKGGFGGLILNIYQNYLQRLLESGGWKAADCHKR